MKIELSVLMSFLLPLIIAPTLVSSQFHEFGNSCLGEEGNYTSNSTYQNNLKFLLSNLTEQASHAPFGNYSVGKETDKVYMIYMCRGDLNGQECHDCVQKAAERITILCPIQKVSVFWYEECMVRYSNKDIFSLEDESFLVVGYSGANVSDSLRYEEVIARTLDSLIMEAAYNTSLSRPGYAIGEGDVSGVVKGNKVYCLVQCTPDILGSRCERCLRGAVRSMAQCCGFNRQWMEFHLPSCQIRYSPISFIRGTALLPVSPPDNSIPPPPPRTGGSTTRMIKADGYTLIFGVIVASSILFILPTSN